MPAPRPDERRAAGVAPSRSPLQCRQGAANPGGSADSDCATPVGAIANLGLGALRAAAGEDFLYKLIKAAPLRGAAARSQRQALPWSPPAALRAAPRDSP